MSEPIKIALTGKFRSGKDAVAERLFYEHGFEWPIAFGGKLKYYADRLFDVSEGDRKPRKLYQQFGQLCRTIDKDVWIKHVEYSVNHALDQRSTLGIVISDLRQPNEYEWCKRNGFVIVRVVSPLEARVKRAEIAGDAFELADLAHSTESYVDGFDVDYDVVNDSTLAELQTKVDAIVAEIIRKGAD